MREGFGSMTVQNSENLVADLPPEQVFLFSSACQNPDSFARTSGKVALHSSYLSRKWVLVGLFWSCDIN